MDMFVYVNMCLYMYLYIDWEKTEAQRKKEQMLLEELVSIVNKRDELVRQRDYEEKGSVMHTSHNICLLTYLLKSSFFLKSQVCRIIFHVFHEIEFANVHYVFRLSVCLQCFFDAGARCRLAYGPADATATHCLLLH